MGHGAAHGPSSAGPADPYRYVGRFQRLLYGTSEVVPDRVQVDGVLQAGSEGGDGLVGVVAGPVESAVDQPLDPVAQRVE